jgi:hypothetical protein
MTKTTTELTNGSAEKTTHSANQSKRERARTTTKKAQLIKLLERKAGADVATISARFGWLPHTTRAALSGLRKAGYGIDAEKPKRDKPARYRITTQAELGAGK